MQQKKKVQSSKKISVERATEALSRATYYLSELTALIKKGEQDRAEKKALSGSEKPDASRDFPGSTPN